MLPHRALGLNRLRYVLRILFLVLITAASGFCLFSRVVNAWEHGGGIADCGLAVMRSARLVRFVRRIFA